MFDRLAPPTYRHATHAVGEAADAAEIARDIFMVLQSALSPTDGDVYERPMLNALRTVASIGEDAAFRAQHAASVASDFLAQV